MQFLMQTTILASEGVESRPSSAGATCRHIGTRAQKRAPVRMPLRCAARQLAGMLGTPEGTEREFRNFSPLTTLVLHPLPKFSNNA